MAAKKQVKDLREALASKARVSQRDLPRLSLKEALRIPQALFDNFAGRPTSPPNIAMAIDISPTSSAWRILTGAAVGYGLTDGAYNSPQIGPTALSKKYCQPTQEGSEKEALVEAILAPKISAEFFTRYNRQKFPRDDIGRNVLVEMGVPHDDANAALEIMKENGQLAGVIQTTKTGLFVLLEGFGADREQAQPRKEDNFAELPAEMREETQLVGPNTSAQLSVRDVQPKSVQSRLVFVSHGSNKGIVGQLKEILHFGRWEPVVAVDSNTVSKPVPDKVMDDMRRCIAAIIHVATEERAMTADGEERRLLNENVLIEIGAAMALYKRNFVLLVEEGTKLPSNLQGLYEVRYTGEKLDYDATMKLLKTFNDFELN